MTVAFSVADRRVDPVEPVQLVLDAHRARGAAHRRDFQLDLVLCGC